jgi:hypothetical protein
VGDMLQQRCVIASKVCHNNINVAARDVLQQEVFSNRMYQSMVQLWDGRKYKDIKLASTMG